jgi:hypothetical protein
MKRLTLLLGLAATLALVIASVANAEKQIYWWQRNMSTSQHGYDLSYHNHNYNELYFGANAGWSSKVWEVTPAGYVHFVKYCSGNCFFAHPAYYYTGSYCANRDPNGTSHFVYDCMDQW